MKKISLFCTILFFATMAATAQDSTSKEMVGKYKFPAGSVIEEANVTWENGVLTMSSSAGVSVLEKMKGDTFNVVSFSGICVFKRDEAKKVNGVHVDASGYVLDGEKESAKLTEFITVIPAAIAIKQHEEFAGSRHWRSNFPDSPMAVYN